METVDKSDFMETTESFPQGLLGKPMMRSLAQREGKLLGLARPLSNLLQAFPFLRCRGIGLPCENMK
jgi:hypothetical protein